MSTQTTTVEHLGDDFEILKNAVAVNARRAGVVTPDAISTIVQLADEVLHWKTLAKEREAAIERWQYMAQYWQARLWDFQAGFLNDITSLSPPPPGTASPQTGTSGPPSAPEQGSEDHLVNG